jgi:type IV secretory pathway component VirB8
MQNFSEKNLYETFMASKSLVSKYKYLLIFSMIINVCFAVAISILALRVPDPIFVAVSNSKDLLVEVMPRLQDMSIDDQEIILKNQLEKYIVNREQVDGVTDEDRLSEALLLTDDNLRYELIELRELFIKNNPKTERYIIINGYTKMSNDVRQISFTTKDIDRKSETETDKRWRVNIKFTTSAQKVAFGDKDKNFLGLVITTYNLMED